MRSRGDERGQSVQLGALLLFATFMITFSTYQAFAVPDQNRAVEFDHHLEVQEEITSLGNALATAPGDRRRGAVDITLGMRYPSRLLGTNPGVVTGSLRTAGTTDASSEITVVGATASGATGDFWNGTTHSYTTGWVVYEPNYNEYTVAERTIYENTVVYNEGPGGNQTRMDQRLVEGRTISLVALNGSLSTTRPDTVAVEPQYLSASTNGVLVSNETTGVAYEYYEADYGSVTGDMPAFAEANRVKNGSGGAFNITDRDRDDDFAFRFVGRLDVQTAGTHTFETTAVERSELYLDGSEIHDSDTASPGTVTLSPGTYNITVIYYDHDGSESLGVRWQPPGEGSLEPIPERRLTNERGYDATPLQLRLPTRLGNETWEPLLSDQLIENGGRVQDAYVDPSGDLRIELQGDTEFRLKAARVGLGTNTTTPGPVYITDVAGNGSTVPEGQIQRVTVEVRDRFNNPLSGVTVNATTDFDNSSVKTASVTTDEHGRASVTYEAPADVDGTAKHDRLNVSFAVTPDREFDPGTAANLTTTLRVENTDASGLTTPAHSAYAINWADPAAQNGVTCSPDVNGTCEIDGSTTMAPELPISATPSVDGLNVTFSTDTSSVAWYNTTNGTNNATTNTSATATTEMVVVGPGDARLTGSAGGDIDVLDISITNAKPVKGYWPLGEASGESPVVDVAGGNDGELNATVDQGVDGIIGTAYEFNGTWEYVDLPETDDIPEGDEAYALHAWFAADNGNDRGGIVGYGEWHGSPGKSNALRLRENSDDDIEFRHYWWGSQDMIVRDTGITFDDGFGSEDWHHVVAQYNGTKREVWLDGQRVAVDDDPVGEHEKVVKDVRIGKTNTQGDEDELFDGKIDEVRIYDRALTDAEIRALCNAGNETCYP